MGEKWLASWGFSVSTYYPFQCLDPELVAGLAVPTAVQASEAESRIQALAGVQATRLLGDSPEWHPPARETWPSDSYSLSSSREGSCLV